MRKRNNIFAEAFRWLKAHRENEGKGVKYQKDLAAIIGVSEDTITRIMRDQTEVTDDFLCKFNKAFNYVFNYQWLRGEDDFPMFATEKNPQQSAPPDENLLELYAQRIRLVDDLRAILKEELAEVRNIRADLQEARDAFRDATYRLSMLINNNTEQPPLMAAEN